MLAFCRLCTLSTIHENSDTSRYLCLNIVNAWPRDAIHYLVLLYPHISRSPVSELARNEAIDITSTS